MPRVRIYAWNPRRSWLPPRIARSRLARWVPVGRRINNFGDLLGPLVVERVLAQRRLTGHPGRRDCTLFSIGSVLHNAQDGDVVWGAGINGKMPLDLYAFDSLDVRAVRDR
jgi:pyruvyltransferase